jgi:hypothetical protein
LTKLDFGSLRLLGYDLPQRKLKIGDQLPLTMLWQAKENIGRDYALRMEAVGPGNVVFDWEPRRPHGDSYPTPSWSQGELVRDWQDFVLTAKMRAGEYRLHGKVLDMNSGDEVGSVDFGTIEIDERPAATTSNQQIATRVAAQFGDSIELLGYDIQPKNPHSGDTVQLVLHWKALKEMDRSYSVFAHLLDNDNHIWGQDDSVPGRGELPTTSWLTDNQIADLHPLSIKADAPPGQYTLEIGIYDSTTFQRLVATSSQVQLMDNAVLLTKLNVER